MPKRHDSEQQYAERDKEDDQGKPALAPEPVLCATCEVATGVDTDQADDGDPGRPVAPLWMWGQLNADASHDERELHSPAKHEWHQHVSWQMAGDGLPELPEGREVNLSHRLAHHPGFAR